MNKTLNKIKDKIEGIIHAYAVNHHNAREGDWRERRRVRNLAVDDLMDLISNEYFQTRLKEVLPKETEFAKSSSFQILFNK